MSDDNQSALARLTSEALALKSHLDIALEAVTALSSELRARGGVPERLRCMEALAGLAARNTYDARTMLDRMRRMEHYLTVIADHSPAGTPHEVLLNARMGLTR